MSDDTSNVVQILGPSERDAQVLALRLAGHSIRKIAVEFRMTDKAILESLDRSLPCLDASTRARYLRESLAELDELKSWWHARAKESASAAAIVLKIGERRSALLGLDAAQTSRMDPVQVVEEAAPSESSSSALLRELNRIAGERPARSVVVDEHEATPPADPAA
jgi:hypothetical protein